MRMVDVIIRKRNGLELRREEIEFFIDLYAEGKVPEYQASALAMAIYFRGMSDAEVAALTEAMMRSGDCFDLAPLGCTPVDKHSTGGVGDKVSLALAPLAAAAGAVVPMVSGRGLGHTGGTLDKLEAIPGFKVNLEKKAYLEQLERIGVVMVGQSERFVPADKKLYALRDVTGTVESIPLITASILSKKIASGARGLVMDVKTGSGAFMDEEDEARELALLMAKTGRQLGAGGNAVRVVSYLTDMNQPLGREIGNANETIEAIETLKGRGPDDLTLLVETLCAEMLALAGVAEDFAGGLARTRETLRSGKALEKFATLIEAQGGDPRVVDDYGLFDAAEHSVDVPAAADGFIAALQTREIGNAACLLGAGRETVADAIDAGVGVTLLKKLGEPVAAGEPVFRVAWRDPARRDACLSRLAKTITIAQDSPQVPELIKDRIE